MPDDQHAAVPPHPDGDRGAPHPRGAEIPPRPDDPAPSIRPAAITFGAASAALAAGVIVTSVLAHGTSTAGGTDAVGVTPTGAGNSDATTPPPTSSSSDGSSEPTGDASESSTESGTGTTTGAPGDLSGNWTGSIDGGGTPGTIKLTLTAADPAAITGMLLFGDPVTTDWVYGGEITGSLDGGSLSLATNSDADFDLTVNGSDMSGKGELTKKASPFPVTVKLKRA
jgi:hypothetical protein